MQLSVHTDTHREYGSGFRAWGLGFRAWGLGHRVVDQGWGCRTEDSGSDVAHLYKLLEHTYTGMNYYTLNPKP